MVPAIFDLIDFEKTDTLLEGFSKSTGFVTAILDLEGKVLSKSGWRQICTEFHRVNPETSTKCTISDTVLAGKSATGEKYHFCKCLNGLIDVAAPIVIKGEHIANLFSGQFFIEKPDVSFFKEQARIYGFDEINYLKALGEVPVISEVKVLEAMDFLLDMIRLISETTSQKLELLESLKTITESEERHQLIFENSLDAILLTSPDGSIFAANPAACKMFQRTEEELYALERDELIDISDPRLPLLSEEREKKGKVLGTLTMIKKDGSKFPTELTSSVFTDKNGQEKTSMIIRDISERIKAEERIKNLNRVYTVLSNINETIVRTHDKQLLFNEVCRIAVEDGGFLLTWIGIVNPTTNKVEVVASAGKTEGYLNDINIDLKNKQRSSGPTGIAIKTGKIDFSNDIETDDKMIPWRQSALKSGFRSSITFPIIVSGKTIGAYTMYSDKTDYFNEAEIKLLNELAIDISFALEYIENEIERRQAEEELEKNRELLQSIIDGTTDAIYVKDTDGKYLIFNHAAEFITGKKFEEVLGKDDTILLPAEEAAVVMFGDQKVIAEGKIATYEEYVTTAEGNINTFLTTKGPILDKGGNPVGLFGVARDISERKMSEEALRENNSRLELAMQSANMAWWEMDIITGNVIFDKHKSEMLGYPAETFSHYKDFMALVHPGDSGKAMKAMKRHMDGLADKYEIEYRILTKSGAYKWFYDIGAVVKKDAVGKPLKAAGLVIDITEQKKSEEKIKKLNEELEQRVIERTSQLEAVNKELETFTYSVSHDLKAPLRGIDGYSKLLIDLYTDALPDEAKSFVSTIRKSTRQMNQLIEDLLEYSRLERSQFRNEKINISELMASITLIYKNELETGNFTLKANIPDIELVADEKGLTIALRNLIENAIKFSAGTAHPAIEIEVEENTTSWIIRVADNGIGFDMKYSERIFEIFQRLQRPEDYPGTGIGLAMVNKAMQRMQGKAWATGIPGQGSSFYLEIPKNAPPC